MELRDTPETYLFKLWPWFEANKIRLLWGGGIVVVAAGLFYFRFNQQAQNEIDAGVALTRLMLSEPRNNTAENQAGLFQKVAGDYRGTVAAQRALLQSAALLFQGRMYADAQARFQAFLSRYPDSTLAPQAALGVAAGLDAQGKTDAAAAAYQRVFSSYSDPGPAAFARFRLAQIDEQLGKGTEALNLYEDVARSSSGSMVGNQAGLRAMELKMSSAPATAHPAPAAPLKSNP